MTRYQPASGGKSVHAATLVGMYQIAADNLVYTGTVLQAMQMNLVSLASPQRVIDGADKELFIAQLGGLKNGCDTLKLVCTRDLLSWVIEDYSNNPHNFGQVKSSVEYISATFQQELSRNFFAYVETDKAKYFRSVEQAISDPPFGAEALRSFQSALRDIALAGNCFACGFDDACVFHLMRVLEKGLGSLAAIFSVPFKFENWHTVIEQLESKIRKIDPSHGADWKEKQKFYSEIACEFMFFKDAWRNHVMHGRDSYDTESAQNIYSHVCAFMKKLALGGLTE
ncbi:MAG: hypothetical protein LAP39_13915 [Acidobacteriia bacterium]|nr:hypothetical protein [Terriglobia bacterium]